MNIRLDHTIVPALDKEASARFFAEIFGLEVTGVSGPFAQVQVNEELTLDFADDPDHCGEAGYPHHYAFRISDADFDAVHERIISRGIPYGSGPFTPEDGEINRRRGGRGFYFKDPAGHLLEVMTTAETGS